MAKKEYVLRYTPVQENDRAPAFVQRAMTWAKATNEITGLIRGILADGVVNEQEALYLRNWIQQRPDLLKDSLVRGLAARVQRVFVRGAASSEELDDLKSILQEYSVDDNTPTSLPLDSPAPDLIIPNKTFCFTGTFVSGNRSWCETQISNRGGRVINTIYDNLSYLIIGSRVSGAWRNQTYGKKIERAVECKQFGCRIAIVCEDHWLKFL